MKHMLGFFRVAVLQESTKEAHRNLKPNPSEWLNEIYSLRRRQERYQRGEIG